MGFSTQKKNGEIRQTLGARQEYSIMRGQKIRGHDYVEGQ